MSGKKITKRCKPGYVIEEFLVTPHANMAGEKVSAVQAIRRFCWECQGGHEHGWRMDDGSIEPRERPINEVKECKARSCWLWPYRNGTNPQRAGLGGRKASENTPQMEL